MLYPLNPLIVAVRLLAGELHTEVEDGVRFLPHHLSCARRYALKE